MFSISSETDSISWLQFEASLAFVCLLFSTLMPEHSLTILSQQGKSTVFELHISFLGFESIFRVQWLYLSCVGEGNTSYSSMELEPTAISVAALPPGVLPSEKLWK
jgi:hypothetical protein